MQWLVVTRLIGLAGDESADLRVRAVAAHARRRSPSGSTVEARSPDRVRHAWAVAAEIRRFLARPDPPHRRAEPLPGPPGDPIGGARVDDR